MKQEEINKEEFNIKIAEWIRLHREQKGISQNQLAKISGVSQSIISDYKGMGIKQFNYNPSIDSLRKISEGLGITLSSLFKYIYD